MRYFSFLLPLSLATLPAFAAQAASSDWHDIEGGSIRIVTSETPDAAGQLRGALEIRLKPGWKTYWRDPGASGVPPALEMTAGANSVPVEIDFPAPSRFDDGYVTWAGYDQPIALALTMDLSSQTRFSGSLDASIFLGVCEAICIPVSTTLSLRTGNNASNFEQNSLIEAAFSALPHQEQPNFFAKIISKNHEAILIAVEVPEGLNLLDLFVASSQELTLDTPQEIEGESQILFRVPIMAHGRVSGEDLAYTLVTDGGAISGYLQLP